MNKVLWLQKASKPVPAFLRMRRITEKEKGSDSAGEKRIFISLPRKAKLKNAHPVFLPPHPFTYVALPENYDRGFDLPNSTPPMHRKGFFSAAVISLFSLLLSVFAAIGLLNILASGLRLPVYQQSFLRLEEAAHKPGPGPAAEDAVTNEYQNALTREMVAAADTSGDLETTGSNAGTSGMLGEIKITEENQPGISKSTTASRKLKICNSTKRTLDRVVVQIEVLGEGGRLLRTESHTAKNMAPMAVEVFEVAGVLPDAEINCYVQEVRSKTLRTMLRSL